MNEYLYVLKNYFKFDGRARRREYWMFVLFNLIISIVLGLVTGFINHTLNSIVGMAYSLALLIPSLAVGSRRLHDTGRSAWWLLLLLIPIFGWIALIVFYVFDSQPGDNKYGPNPKGMDGSTTAPMTSAPVAEAPAPAPTTTTPPDLNPQSQSETTA